MADDDSPDPRAGPVAAVRWFRSTEHEGVVLVREVLSTVAVVAAVGLLLFAASGVWPPMVAVQSGSMEPNMYRGDLVFVMDEQRLVPDAAVGETGVVPYAVGLETDRVTFGDYGDVIVYRPDGSERRVPVIHRVRFWVDGGENWYGEADERFVPDHLDGCAELPDCPAPHAGFVTKGDNNRYYDQAQGTSGVVRPSWIRGTAELRVPWLGHVRLLFSNLLGTAGPVTPVPPAGPAVPLSVSPPSASSVADLPASVSSVANVPASASFVAVPPVGA